MTESAFSGQPNQQKVDNLIRKVQLLADRNMKESFGDNLQSRFRGRSVDCKSGCDYCCRQGVSATVPEVLALAAWFRSHKTAKEVSALKKAAHAYWTRFKRLGKNALSSSRAACPLLIGHRCTAYEARPLVCRSFHSFDVHACEALNKGDSNAVHLGEHVQRNVIQVMDALRYGLRAGLPDNAHGKRPLLFGAALGIAMDNEDATERWLAGEDLFSDAAI